MADREGQEQQSSLEGFSQDPESWLWVGRLDLFSKRDKAAPHEDLLGFFARDPMLLKSLGGISLVPFKGKLGQREQPVPQPLSELEFRHMR
ncbi:MAG: hypothetical protein LAP13_07360 [Acidobacteriia bacterium]|nr:hypothetical protein [Terriglobia bacterium]